MKFVPNIVQLKSSLAVLKVREHSPTILFAGGVVGVVATTVLACKATLKLEEVLEETESQREKAVALLESGNPRYDEAKFKHDSAFLYARSAVDVAKLYAPAVIVGALSIAALTGSHKILSNRNAAVTAAYAATTRALEEYRGRVRKEYGEGKERELYYGSLDREVVEVTNKGDKITTVKSPDPGVKLPYAKFFDEDNANWSHIPEYNMMFLRAQENMATERLRAKGYLLLNDVYDMLGFDRTDIGMIAGWKIGNGDDYVDFGCFTDERMNNFHDYVMGHEQSVLLDFNVDGSIYGKLGGRS